MVELHTRSCAMFPDRARVLVLILLFLFLLSGLIDSS